MAVFVSASDESAGKDRLDQFVFAGWISSERDWSEIFSPAWQRLVLDGPPAIPYLHMTEIRSKKWREQNGISEQDASERIDRAVKALATADFLFPIGLKVSGADIRSAFATTKIRSSNRRSIAFEPDFLCFLGYAMLALEYVSQEHPECKKLDFIVERNGKITDYIKDFHADISRGFEELGRPHLARLVGELIPTGKDRIPAQAADVLCWHTARSGKYSQMDKDDLRRYGTLARKSGRLESLSKEDVEHLANLLQSK